MTSNDFRPFLTTDISSPFQPFLHSACGRSCIFRSLSTFASRRSRRSRSTGGRHYKNLNARSTLGINPWHWKDHKQVFLVVFLSNLIPHPIVCNVWSFLQFFIVKCWKLFLFSPAYLSSSPCLWHLIRLRADIFLSNLRLRLDSNIYIFTNSKCLNVFCSSISE